MKTTVPLDSGSATLESTLSDNDNISHSDYNSGDSYKNLYKSTPNDWPL